MTKSTYRAEELRDANERLLISGLREQELADAARREKAQLHAVLEALHDGVVLIDAAGRILMMNSVARTAVELATATSSIDAAFLLDFRRLDGTVLPADQHPLRRAMRGEEFVEAELTLVRRSGEKRRVMATGKTTAAAGDEVLAIVVLRDVTERRRLEARLAQSEKLAALGTLSAGMAHEINTPLAYVLGNVDVALEALPGIQQRLLELDANAASTVGGSWRELDGALRDAKEGTTRVHRIVEDLKKLAGDDMPAASLELHAVIESAVRMTGSYLRDRAVVRRAFRAVPLVRANASRLGQVFSSLLMNAAYAARGEGAATGRLAEIVVSTYTDHLGRAVGAVRDYGPGIADELKTRIFEPFFTTKPVGQGTGLGLSICFSIVQSLGGQLSVDSELGKGATFLVLLPAADRDPVATVAPVPPAPSSQRGRVLVVDDEPAIGRVLKRLLQSEHDVAVEDDSRAALARLLRGEVFDVILCDVMMPGLGGPELLAELRRHDAQLAERVIFVTGGAFGPRAQEFLASVPNMTLTKPLDAAVLRQAVNDGVAASRAAVMTG